MLYRPHLLPQLSLLCALLAASGFGVAQTEERVDHLYRALVPLADRSEAAQQRAMRDGFIKVLQKISGYSGVANLEGMASEVARSHTLPTEFGIQTLLVPSEDGITATSVEALRVVFPESQITEIFRRHELPLWPSNRARIGSLFLSNVGGQPLLLTEADYPAGYAWLRRAAYDRGIPLDVPSPQMQAQLSSSAEQLWQLDELLIRLLMADLDLDQIALVRIHANDPARLADITRIDRFGSRTIPLQGQNLLLALSQEFNGWVDDQSMRTAFVARQGVVESQLVSIEGVRTFAEYQHLLNYFASLEQIGSFTLIQANAERVDFSVHLQSSAVQLRNAITASGIMQPVADTEDSFGPIRFTYRAGRLPQI